MGFNTWRRKETTETATLPLQVLFNTRLGFLVVQTVKNLPATQETWVRSLGQKDPLEKETAIHSSILAWRIPWTEKSGELQSIVLQRLGRDWATNVFTFGENIGYSPSWLSKVLIHSIVRGECEQNSEETPRSALSRHKLRGGGCL